MSNITVFTALTNGFDGLQEEQNKGSARFLAYCDEPQWSKTWEILPAYDKFKDPRRNSRIHKILSHRYSDSEYSIWIDANLRLLVPPEQLIEEHLKNHDLAIFQHSTRDCIYDEALACMTFGKEDKAPLVEQTVAYGKMGFPAHRGLTENNVILRRHTSKVEEFNNAWWTEYCRYSKRDQISLMPTLDIVGLRINIIPITWEFINGTFVRGGVEQVPHLKI